MVSCDIIILELGTQDSGRTQDLGLGSWGSSGQGICLEDLLGGFTEGFAGFRGSAGCWDEGASRRLARILGLMIIEGYEKRCNKLLRSGNEQEYIDVIA